MPYFPPDISSDKAVIAWTVAERKKQLQDTRDDKRILSKATLGSIFRRVYHRICQWYETENQVFAPRTAEHDEQVDLEPVQLTFTTQQQETMRQARCDPLLQLTESQDEQAAFARTVEIGQFQNTNETVMDGNSSTRSCREDSEPRISQSST